MGDPQSASVVTDVSKAGNELALDGTVRNELGAPDVNVTGTQLALSEDVASNSIALGADDGGINEYKIVGEALKELKLEKYEEAFRRHEMSDSVVKECLAAGDMSFFKDLIPVIAQQFKFKKEFTCRVEAGAANDPQSGMDANREFSAKASEPSSGTTVDASAADAAKNESEMTPPRPRFTTLVSIAEAHGWRTKARKPIWRKIVGESVKSFDDAVQDGQKAERDFLDDEELEDLIDEADEAAVDRFDYLTSDLTGEEDEIREKRKVLLNELSRKREEAKASNNGKKKKSQLRLEREAAAITEKHMREIRKQMGDAVHTRIQMEKFFNECLPNAEEEYENRCENLKGFDPDFFYDKMEAAREDLWKELEDENNARHGRTASLSAAVLDHYKDGMTSCLDEDEFDSAHNDILAKIEAIIADTPDLDEKIKRECLDAFKKREKELKAEALQQMRARRESFMQVATEIVGKSCEFYDSLMKPLLSKGVPIQQAILDSKHDVSKKQVWQHFKTSMEGLQRTFTLNQKRKDVVWNRIEEIMDRKHQECQGSNAEQWIALKDEIKGYVQSYKDQYGSEMEELSEKAVNLSEFERSEKKIRQSLLNEFGGKLNAKLQDASLAKDYLANLDQDLLSEKDGHQDVFNMNQKENEVHVKNALFDAKRYYNDEMGKKFRNKPWYEPDELQKVHNEVLKNALDDTRVDIELTQVQQFQLKEAMKIIYEGYVEENERRRPNKAAAIGIDLGTTYSCVGVYFNGTVQIIPNKKVDEKTTIPSYVAFRDDKTIEVGAHAKAQAYKNPMNTIFDAKRLIGRKFTDQVVQDDLKLWPFDVVNTNGEPRIKVKGKNYRPEEISAKVLAKMKEIAEDYLNRPVTKAVITVPAYFGDAQRKATKDAAKIANLEALILNEPTAAAFAYQLHRTGDLRKNILIFDLGGGTFDVAILTVDKGEMTVKAVGGDDHLGGEDFDSAMVEALIERVKQKYGIDLARDRHSTDDKKKLKASSRLRRLRTYCEEQKKSLSDAPVVSIEIDALDDGFDLSEEFTQEEFNRINMERFQKCIDVVRKTLEEARMSKGDIDDVVLVGGSTRIPKVQEMLKAFFDNKKELTKTINADEAVAWGAAYHAALLEGEQITADEAKLRFKDVTPKSLGVAVYPDKMNVIIKKNTTVPCSVRSTGYTTLRDYQTTCDVVIYEGEDELVKNNTMLGMFRLTGIPSAPKGQEKMECTMTIDDEGVLHVEAQVVTNGQMASLRIETYNGRMTQQEIEEAKNQPIFYWE